MAVSASQVFSTVSRLQSSATMNVSKVFAVALIFSNQLINTSSVSPGANRMQISPRGLPWWSRKGAKHRGPPRHYSRQSDDAPDTMMPTMMSDNEMEDTRLAPANRLPVVNFYSSIPNAIGVMGTSLLWLREISAAIGTPLPLWIFGVPAVVLGIGLMFMPDLTQFNLPLFYPDGIGEGDPLASFPPSIKNISFVNPANSIIILPKLIMDRLVHHE